MTLKLLKMNDITPHVVIFFFDTCTRIWNFLPTFLVCSTILMIAFGHSGYTVYTRVQVERVYKSNPIFEAKNTTFLEKV